MRLSALGGMLQPARGRKRQQQARQQRVGQQQAQHQQPQEQGPWEAVRRVKAAKGAVRLGWADGGMLSLWSHLQVGGSGSSSHHYKSFVPPHHCQIKQSCV